MASCPTEMATSLNWKKFNGKKFHHKNFCWMPATTKIFYELFSCEYLQQ